MDFKWPARFYEYQAHLDKLQQGHPVIITYLDFDWLKECLLDGFLDPDCASRLLVQLTPSVFFNQNVPFLQTFVTAKRLNLENVAYHGCTPLMSCALSGLVQSAEFLLNRGAMVNALYFLPNLGREVSPLDLAVWNEQHAMAALLLQRGADLSLPEVALSVIRVADLTMLHLLVAYGFNVYQTRAADLPELGHSLLETAFLYASRAESRLLCRSMVQADEHTARSVQQRLRLVQAFVDYGCSPISAEALLVALRRHAYLTLVATLKFYHQRGRIVVWPTPIPDSFLTEIVVWTPTQDLILPTHPLTQDIAFLAGLLRDCVHRTFSEGDRSALLRHLNALTAGTAHSRPILPTLMDLSAAAVRHWWIAEHRVAPPLLPAAVGASLAVPLRVSTKLDCADLEERTAEAEALLFCARRVTVAS